MLCEKVILILIIIIELKIPSANFYPHKSNNAQEDIYNQCDNIKQPICQNLLYTKTKMPNSVGITNQVDAAKRMNDYFPLINAGCSHYFQFFLCSIYFPMCSEMLEEKRSLLPCKTLCVYIQSRCEPYMEAFKLKWPLELSCTSLPENSSICVHPKTYELDQNRTLDSDGINSLKKLYPNWNSIFSLQENSRLKFNPLEKLGGHENGPKCLISHVPLTIGYDNKTKTKIVTCSARCDSNTWYSSSDKNLARIWYFIWTILCLISSVVAIATFSFDKKIRFMYPERPIIFMVLCYGCMCLFNLFQFGLERKRLVCQTSQSNQNEEILMREGFESPMCTLTFLGMYYFEMVASLWWLMLAISCYLASARKWSCEGLERVSNIMHIVAWTVPAISTTVILILHKIDADELLDSCYVGRQNSKSNLFFILLPRLIYFLLGSILLVISFKSLLVLRKNIANNKLNLIVDPLQNQQSLEKFIAKTGIFCGVYGIPMTCYIGCQVYYYMNIDEWNKIGHSNLRSECVNRHGLRWSDKSCLQNLSLPLIEIRLLEIFSTLVIGITSGMWMWCNKKTSMNLHRFLSTTFRFRNKDKPDNSIPILMKQTTPCNVTNPKVNSSVFLNKFNYPQIDVSSNYNSDLSRLNQQIIICNV